MVGTLRFAHPTKSSSKHSPPSSTFCVEEGVGEGGKQVCRVDKAQRVHQLLSRYLKRTSYVNQRE